MRRFLTAVGWLFVATAMGLGVISVLREWHSCRIDAWTEVIQHAEDTLHLVRGGLGCGAIVTGPAGVMHYPAPEPVGVPLILMGVVGAVALILIAGIGRWRARASR